MSNVGFDRPDSEAVFCISLATEYVSDGTQFDGIAKMRPGSVVVDLAAERGGNCELTKPGETVVDSNVAILGPANLPAEIPYHASQMYAKNIATFLLNMVDDGQLKLDLDDEIVRDTLVARDGKIANPRVAEALGIEVETPANE